MKAYVKPELNVKAYAQFENVFTACTRNTNNDKFGCSYCGPHNPGAESKPCPICGYPNNEHSAHSAVATS